MGGAGGVQGREGVGRSPMRWGAPVGWGTPGAAGTEGRGASQEKKQTGAHQAGVRVNLRQAEVQAWAQVPGQTQAQLQVQVEALGQAQALG